MKYNKVRQKLTHENRTKQTEEKELNKTYKKMIQMQRSTHLSIQESRKHTEPEAVTFMQRMCRVKRGENKIKNKS